MAAAFRGNFPQIGSHHSKPILTLNGHEVTPIVEATDTSAITFSISPSWLIPPSVHQISLNQMQLVLPYQNTCLIICRPSRAVYFALLGAMPPVAGHYSVVADYIERRTEERSVTSQVVGLSSQDCCDRHEIVCDPQPIPPDSIVVNGSIKMNVVNEHDSRKDKDWAEHGPRINTHVCWDVQTWQHHHGTDGNVDFTISYTILQTIKVPTRINIADADLFWGDSKVLSLPADTQKWSVTFTPFDSQQAQQRAEPGYFNSRYAVVSRPSEGQLQIAASPPPEIQ